MGDIGGGGLYGCWCAWRGWCEAEEEEERRWACAPVEGAGAVEEVADS